MQRKLLALVAAAGLFATGALAKDRPVTDDERTKLTVAVTAAGCSGGKMEFDGEDNHFSVEDAQCNDGRKYELKFDASFKLIKKEMDD